MLSVYAPYFRVDPIQILHRKGTSIAGVQPGVIIIIHVIINVNRMCRFEMSG